MTTCIHAYILSEFLVAVSSIFHACQLSHLSILSSIAPDTQESVSAHCRASCCCRPSSKDNHPTNQIRSPLMISCVQRPAPPPVPAPRSEAQRDKHGHIVAGRGRLGSNVSLVAHEDDDKRTSAPMDPRLYLQNGVKPPWYCVLCVVCTD